jgi:hypothetical protein
MTIPYFMLIFIIWARVAFLEFDQDKDHFGMRLIAQGYVNSQNNILLGNEKEKSTSKRATL